MRSSRIHHSAEPRAPKVSKTLPLIEIDRLPGASTGALSKDFLNRAKDCGNAYASALSRRLILTIRRPRMMSRTGVHGSTYCTMDSPSVDLTVF